jgi:alpha-N-acetylglucosaminidase
MLARMHVLGIEPVMPAFFGMVPSTLKDKMKAHIITQGAWGAFTRPDILDPTDTAFARIAGIFYEETKRSYGKDIHFFSGDPFHEGGITDGVDLGAAGRNIQQAMQAYFPGSVWVLQGWQVNPRAEMLAGLDRSKVLVQELFGETTNNWEKRKAYEGTPFVWCMITNYGERPGLFGKLQRYADEPYRARHGEYADYIKGIGIMPEGIDNNPAAYDLMLEVGWRQERMDVASWISKYTQYRYGRLDTDIVNAWQLLLKTVYSSPEGYQEGPPENVLCARPALQIKSVSTWGTLRKNYDTALFAKAVELFVRAEGRLKGCETYQIDRINFQRQVLANKADKVFAEVVAAFNGKDSLAFERAARRFLRLHDESEAVLNGHAFYRLDRYKLRALASGNTPEEKRNNLSNALMLVTYWGENNRKEDNLHEYAYKEWAGMMVDFYKRRWEMYFDYLRSELRGVPAQAPDFFAWEREWESRQERNGATDRGSE